MKKIGYGIFVVLLITALALPFLRADHKVSFDIMKKEVNTLAGNKDFDKKDVKYIRKMYEINDSDYDDIICYGVPSAMEVNEFTVVYVKDENKRAFVLKQLRSRIDKQYKSFSGYAPRQAQLLKKAVLYERGDYVIMIIHKDAVSMKDNVDDLF